MIYVVGIDEAGRGPLAGPVAVGAVALLFNETEKIRKTVFANGIIRDSKKLSPEERTHCYERMLKLNIRIGVSLVGNHVIDKFGISSAIRRALKESLKKLEVEPYETLVLLDGGLKAPAEYKQQKTIIKGDERELSIALASIAAKVRRDEVMKKLAQKYPKYGLEIHKGYGTLEHRKKIKRYGISAVHRKTFIAFR